MGRTTAAATVAAIEQGHRTQRSLQEEVWGGGGLEEPRGALPHKLQGNGTLVEKSYQAE